MKLATPRVWTRLISTAALGLFVGFGLPARAQTIVSDTVVLTDPILTTDVQIVDASSELNYELSACKGCSSEVSADGTSVVVPSAETAEVAPLLESTALVTAPIETVTTLDTALVEEVPLTTTTLSTDTFSKTSLTATTTSLTTTSPYCSSQIARNYHYENGFGNSNFGAGYVVDASVNNTPGTLGPTFDARGEGRVYGRLFGQQRDAVRVTVSANSPAGGAASASANVYVLGSQVFARSFTATYSTGASYGPRRFFSASFTFTVGPVPVTVSASADGSVGFTATGDLSASTLVVNVTPTGSLSAVASAYVNAIVVSFGVDGSLTLITGSLPSNLTISPCAATRWSIAVNRDIYTLSGQIDLWVKVKLLFISKKWTVTIARWSGTHSVGTIYSASGV
ncbi:MAG TPA: hypothetical protein VH877_01955 [Polyangia bacterium]|nr:hypothetical protein [Polyangia bacterium]